MGTTDKTSTTFKKVGILKSKTTGGCPAKTILYLGIQNGVRTVILKQYALADEKIADWKPVKKFKGVVLYQNDIHIRYGTFMRAAQMIEWDADSVYRKIELYLARNKKATK
jgi:hypothetical protein